MDSAGVLARGSAKVVSTSRLGTGSYEVIFTRSVAKCSFTATIGTTSTGSIPAPGQATVAGRAGNNNGVFIRIVDRAGNSLDPGDIGKAGVDLSLLDEWERICATSQIRIPDVGDLWLLRLVEGNPNRGTYEVIFNRTVSGCSYTPSVGTTGNGGSISTPVTITTATRAGNSNGVFIFIHQTNGATIDEPFHLTVYC